MLIYARKTVNNDVESTQIKGLKTFMHIKCFWEYYLCYLYYNFSFFVVGVSKHHPFVGEPPECQTT